MQWHIWQKQFHISHWYLNVIVYCSVPDKLLLEKNPVISFHVVEDGIRPVDEADGNLVIDTSEGHQVGIEQAVLWIHFDIAVLL